MINSERYEIDEYGQVHRTGTTNRSSNISRLDVSSDSLFFTKSGGSRTITLTTNGKWNISLGAASWVHLIKNGNSLSVWVDYNYSLDSRTDHFRVKSGNAERTVKIYQSGSVSSPLSGPKVPQEDNEKFSLVGCLYIIIFILIIMSIIARL